MHVSHIRRNVSCLKQCFRKEGAVGPEFGPEAMKGTRGRACSGADELWALARASLSMFYQIEFLAGCH